MLKLPILWCFRLWLGKCFFANVLLLITHSLERFCWKIYRFFRKSVRIIYVSDGTSHVLTYRNSVKRTRDSSSSTIEGTGVTISRSSAWQVDTTCTYTAENAVESYFETQGEPLYKATSLNAIQFTMSLYRDAQFSQA